MIQALISKSAALAAKVKRATAPTLGRAARLTSKVRNTTLSAGKYFLKPSVALAKNGLKTTVTPFTAKRIIMKGLKAERLAKYGKFVTVNRAMTKGTMLGLAQINAEREKARLNATLRSGTVNENPVLALDQKQIEKVPRQNRDIKGFIERQVDNVQNAIETATKIKNAVKTKGLATAGSILTGKISSTKKGKAK